MYTVRIKRIYESPAPEDGYRVLVDRLWPRGIKKEAAALDGWRRNIAPSAELRKRFGHEPERFAQFREDYRRELDENPEALEFVRVCEEERSSRDVTLLYAAKDGALSNAAVLREWLAQRMGA